MKFNTCLIYSNDITINQIRTNYDFTQMLFIFFILIFYEIYLVTNKLFIIYLFHLILVNERLQMLALMFVKTMESI